jgi:hypothetical protein
MVGNIPLWKLDKVYQQMIGRELVVFPWYQRGEPIPYEHLAGLITGWIDEMPPFKGKTAYMEHIIILPTALNRTAVRIDMPNAIHAALIERGDIHRILMTVNHDHPKRARLVAWAERLGYVKYAEADGKDWLLKTLTPQGWDTDGKVNTEATGSDGSTCSAAAPATSG